MIFSKKIYKLGKGNHASLWAKNGNTMDLYLFNKKVVKYNLAMQSPIKISPSDDEFGYKSIIIIDDNYYCACYDENMSVTGN